MGRKIDLEDLVDAAEAAEILGLSSATSVSTYRRRYATFPDPIRQSKGGRCQLWLRSDLEAWLKESEEENR